MRTKHVRFGGRQTPRGFLFELSGGHPALDFANTLDERAGDPPRELLRRYGDLVAWGRQSGLLAAAGARALARLATSNPAGSRRALARAVAFREALFGLFHAQSNGKRLDAAALRLVERTAVAALRHRRLDASAAGARWIWRDDAPDAILWRIADAAAALLTSEQLARVRTCDGDGCLWLFLDASRQANRRWCDMTVCGNRAKARRHYRRAVGSRARAR